MNIEIDATDIHEHLPTLANLSKECKHITEMGVRHCVSTWAFLEGLAKTKGKLVSIDIVNPPEANLQAVKDTAKKLGIEFEFRLGDTTKIAIEETDMLFIDTDHTYKQLSRELVIHSDKVNKYMVFHDTESCKELWGAIGEVIAFDKSKESGWKVKQHYQNNNGLTVLERII